MPKHARFGVRTKPKRYTCAECGGVADRRTCIRYHASEAISGLSQRMFHVCSEECRDALFVRAALIREERPSRPMDEFVGIYKSNGQKAKVSTYYLVRVGMYVATRYDQEERTWKPAQDSTSAMNAASR